MGAENEHRARVSRVRAAVAPRLVLLPPAGDAGEPRLPFDVDDSKIRVPDLPSGLVSKTAIVNRLRANTELPFVVVTAPAAYGKTTLLAQWAVRDRRPFAWVSVDRRTANPIVLLRHVAAALHAVDPLEPHVLAALSQPGDSIWTTVIPRLGTALREFCEPPVIVLDNAHRLRSRESHEAVEALVHHLPDNAVLALSGRTAPALPLAEMRADGTVVEIGIEDLALTPKEAHLLLRSTGATPTAEDALELTRACEGWPGALHVAARALGSDEHAAEQSLGEFFRLEYLSRLRPAARRFLRRTAILDEMCGVLCDSVLGAKGSAHELRLAERAGLFVVPLDRHEVWYRYHRLFRKALLRELVEREPDLVPTLHRRAADWYEQHGDLEAAMNHADAAGDARRVARVLTTIALPMYHGGRVEAVEGWLDRFEGPGLLERHPTVAVQGAWIQTLRARPLDARRWLAAADAAVRRRPASTRAASLESWRATIRAWSCKRGASQMVVDAEAALNHAPRDGQSRPPALLALGVGHALLGETTRADDILAEAAVEAGRLDAFDTQALALSERSLIAARRNDIAAAERLNAEARGLIERSGLEAYRTAAIAFALSARAALRHGRWSDARDDLARARELERSPGYLFPWLALQTRIELARSFVALREADAAMSLVTEIDSVLSANPHLGGLGAAAQRLRADVDEMDTGEKTASALTPAELRMLPYLATHCSFPEIGSALGVSRHTVKSQAISVYRKFGVTNRSDAVTYATRIGLVVVGPESSAGPF